MDSSKGKSKLDNVLADALKELDREAERIQNNDSIDARLIATVKNFVGEVLNKKISKSKEIENQDKSR